MWRSTLAAFLQRQAAAARCVVVVLTMVLLGSWMHVPSAVIDSGPDACRAAQSRAVALLAIACCIRGYVVASPVPLNSRVVRHVLTAVDLAEADAAAVAGPD